MPILRLLNLDRRKLNSCIISDCSENIYSQFGEDGVINKIFSVIEPENKWCVEFGAWDGLHFSNTARLIKEDGWQGIQIEGSREKYEELARNFADFPNAHPAHEIIGFEPGVNSLDEALERHGSPKQPDFVSIDVDGNDYHIWNSLKKHRPRVLVIEFNPAVPNDVLFIQDKDMSIHQGASLAAMIELGKKKQYELVAVTNCNAFFVNSSLFPKFRIHDNSIDAMRANVQGRIFPTYDGTIYNVTRPLQWSGGRRAEIDEFQLLDDSERVFYDKLPSDFTP